MYGKHSQPGAVPLTRTERLRTRAGTIATASSPPVSPRTAKLVDPTTRGLLISPVAPESATPRTRAVGRARSAARECFVPGSLRMHRPADVADRPTAGRARHQDRPHHMGPYAALQQEDLKMAECVLLQLEKRLLCERVDG